MAYWITFYTYTFLIATRYFIYEEGYVSSAFFAENATYEAHGALLTSFTPKKANVCYYLNETDKDVYFLDDLEKGEKIEFLPPDPQKDGFTFKGWSTSPSDNTPFDFAAYQKIDDTVLRLFAMWEER